TTTIRGSGTSTFPYGVNLATTGGNVGIGTSNPAYFLDVNGEFRTTGVIYPDRGISTSTWDGGTLGLSTPITSGEFTAIGSITPGTGVFTTLNTTNLEVSGSSTISNLNIIEPLYIGNGSTTNTLLYGSNNSTSTFGYGLTIATNGGNVGIGTSNPAYFLDVNGEFRTTGVIYPDRGISTSTWDGGTIGLSTAVNSGEFTAIGSHTPGTGFFTNLNATGTVRVDGDLVFLSGGVSTTTLDAVIIGGTTPAAGSFTTITANGDLSFNLGGVATSTWDGGTLGLSTAITSGEFTAIGSITPGTGVFTTLNTTNLEVSGSSTISNLNIIEPLYIGNGSTTNTLLYGSNNSTSTFGYGVNLATLGGNVGIGTADTVKLFTIKPRAGGDGLMVTENDSTNSAVYLQGGASGGTVNIYGNNAAAITLDGLTAAIFNENSTADLDFRIESDNNPYMFFLDAGNDLITMGDYSSTGHSILQMGSGNATTTLSGGLAGSATSTFAGDVSIENLYSGMISFRTDGGVMDAMNMPVSSNASGNQGYSFLIDGLPAMTIVGTSNGAGETRNNFVGIGTMYPSQLLTLASSSAAIAIGDGTASTTLRGGVNSTSTFEYGINLATTGGNVGIGTASPNDTLTILPKAASEGITIRESDDGGDAITITAIASGGDIITYESGQIANAIGYSGSYFNNRGQPIDFRIEGDTDEELFFLNGTTDKIGISTRFPSHMLTLFDSTATNHPLFAIGNGSATTTLSGGTAGNATSTFAGDVSIPNLYMGMLNYGTDLGIVDAMDYKVSSAASGEQGYDFLVDGLPVMRVLADSDGAGSVRSLRIELTNNLGTATTTLRAGYGTSTIAGNLAVTGTITAACSGDCLDIAEQYTSINDVEPGDVVVSLSPDSDSPYNSSLVQKSTIGYANNVVGIVSTNPGLVLMGGSSIMGSNGKQTGSTKNPNVALAGRVPVKVTNENGEIKRGDLLVTSSALPGYAMKLSTSTPSGTISIIAMALEDWNIETEKSTDGIKTNKVEVLVKNSIIYNSQNTFSESLEVAENGANIDVPEEYYDFAGKSLINIKSLSSAIGTWSLSEAGEFIAQSIKAKTISVNELVISGDKQITDTGEELDPAVGNSYIKSDTNSRVVYNNRVKASSQIFITFRDNTGGPWWISNQGDGFFEVNVPTSMGYNIRFNYWIVTISSSPPLEKGDTGGFNDDISADSTPPEISDVSESHIATSTITISWQTNEPSDSIISFSSPLVPEGGGEVGDLIIASSTLTTSHVLDLTGLIPDTTYNYKVKSTDEAGNERESADYSFTTAQNSSSPLVPEGGGEEGDSITPTPIPPVVEEPTTPPVPPIPPVVEEPAPETPTPPVVEEPAQEIPTTTIL
ncbi:fibronectin type III domain-containing protein, partial [Candidatus Parcubacteria bacterium]|nr:fibronectin type III domain-containing protein [Candidatus Parcubacteria bacterium]